jgi:hypothetical protein
MGSAIELHSVQVPKRAHGRVQHGNCLETRLLRYSYECELYKLGPMSRSPCSLSSSTVTSSLTTLIITIELQLFMPILQPTRDNRMRFRRGFRIRVPASQNHGRTPNTALHQSPLVHKAVRRDHVFMTTPVPVSSMIRYPAAIPHGRTRFFFSRGIKQSGGFRHLECCPQQHSYRRTSSLANHPPQ